MQGGAGADRLEGGEDNDELFGGTGGDELLGGGGDDLLVGASYARETIPTSTPFKPHWTSTHTRSMVVKAMT